MKTSIELKKELEQTKKEELEAFKIWREAVKSQEYNASIKHPLYKNVWNLRRKIEKIEEKYQIALNREVKVGDGITIYLYSDAHAYTIIKRTAKTITIQRDKATLKEDFKPEIIPGGFAGHCTNNYDQDYDYERNENGRTRVLHWSEKRGNWVADGNGVGLGRHEFYDYNF